MGIPPEDTHGNFCPLCFPVNETPDEIYIGITGVQKGGPPPPPANTPPNGNAKLTNVGGCKWQGMIREWTITVETGVPGTEIFVITPPIFIGFRSIVVPNCVWEHNNDLPGPPGSAYFGGTCKIAWPV